MQKLNLSEAFWEIVRCGKRSRFHGLGIIYVVSTLVFYTLILVTITLHFISNYSDGITSELYTNLVPWFTTSILFVFYMKMAKKVNFYTIKCFLTLFCYVNLVALALPSGINHLLKAND